MMAGLTRITLIKALSLPAAFCLSAALACGSLSEALEGAECFSDDDCGPLNCIANHPVIYQMDMNPTGLGWCSDSNACEPGVQPYCGCVISPMTNEVSCATPYVTSNMVSATVPCALSPTDLQSCICIPPEVTCPYPEP